jgi:hypothetical protein
MSTASLIMQRARDQHPAFTLPQTPDAVALRQLELYRDRLYMEAVEVNRAYFLRTIETPMTPAILADGLLLPSASWVGNVRARSSAIASTTDGETFPVPQLERATVTEALTTAYVVVESVTTPAVPADSIDSVLQLYPKLGGVWDTVQAVLFDYMPRLPRLTAASTDTAMAAEVDESLVMMLAQFMASRGAATLPGTMTGYLASQASGARETYLRNLAGRRSPVTRQVREGMV